FTRSLTVGSSGSDVLELQKVLNQDPATRVATSGVGSPGNETTYFGTLTKNAVIKFQNKYKSEVLTPVGLSYGTGYFGPSTISKISGTVRQTNTVSNTYTSKPVSNKVPKITSISPRKIKTGDYITLKGEGFDDIAQTTVIDNYSGANIYSDFRMSDSGKTLSFKVESLIPYFALGIVEGIDELESSIDFSIGDFFEEGNPLNDVHITVVNSRGMSNTMKYKLIIDEI
ncbi:MAG: peptidoglycan hydrolase-like protein with peptidoglycan-binding domain, partial [Candidatus Paceibacteria bacterium]